MIKGNKVYLRLLEKRDLYILYRLCNEEKVKKYNTISDKIDEKVVKFRKALSIINEKEVLVGFITYTKKEYYDDVYYIGITIGSRYWNRGYGQDAIKALTRYLFDELSAVKIELEVMRCNLRAVNCYKKCGFIEKEIKKNKYCLDGEYIDAIIMGIIRDELIKKEG